MFAKYPKLAPALFRLADWTLPLGSERTMMRCAHRYSIDRFTSRDAARACSVSSRRLDAAPWL
eukprot:3321446-Prymnesium_polylepis.1